MKLLLALAPLVFAALDSTKVIYAINCGGEEYTAPSGLVYSKDQNFIGGISSDFGKQLTPMKYTDTPAVYSTERYGTTDFSYKVPVPADGKYVLILKFSEVWFDREGEKMFHVKVGNHYVASYLDIFAQVGKHAAYDEFVAFELKKGKIQIDAVEVSGGYYDGFLQVDFIKTSYDNPKVNAIVLVQGTLKDTHFAEFNELLAKAKELKEKLAQDYYSSGTDVFEDTINIQALEQSVNDHSENKTLLSVALTVPGSAVVGAIVLALVLLRRISSKKKQD